MSDDRFDIPKEVRSMAEANLKQAREALEGMMTNAQKATSEIESRGNAVREGAKDIGAKAVSYVEHNVSASLDHAQRLLQAKDVSEIMKLHAEYVQEQMKALAEQATDIGKLLGRTTMDATKTKT